MEGQVAVLVLIVLLQPLIMSAMLLILLVINIRVPKKTLLLKHLSSGECLAYWDVVVFVCDSSDRAAVDESSKLAAKLLVNDFAAFDVPYLVVTLYGDPVESAIVSQDINERQAADDHIVVSMISTKLGEVNNLFSEIVNVTRHLPWISISKSEAAQRSCKQYNNGLIIRRSFYVRCDSGQHCIGGLLVAATKKIVVSFEKKWSISIVNFIIVVIIFYSCMNMLQNFYSFFFLKNKLHGCTQVTQQRGLSPN